MESLFFWKYFLKKSLFTKKMSFGDIYNGTPLASGSLETYFCQSRSRRFQVSIISYCLETLNIAKKWLSKTIIQWVFCNVYLLVRNSQNRSEKCKKFEKNKTWSDDDIFWKISAKSTNFEVSVLNFKSRSRYFWWSLGLEVLTRSRSRWLRSRLHHCR